MKKFLTILAVIIFVLTITSCGKQCKCTEVDSTGKTINTWEEKQVNVLGAKMPCSYFDEYTVSGGTISCR